MTAHRRLACMVAGLLLAIMGCGSGDAEEPAPSALGDDAVTVASFNFPESVVLAEIYGQALEASGYAVRRQLDLGPRELVEPALDLGLVELVPEYAGTALQFLSLGEGTSYPDPVSTSEALRTEVAGRGVTALGAAEAQNRNAIVVTEETAVRYSLEAISDLADVAPTLTFGGPPECQTRPLCLQGLESVYGLEFREFVPLDAGGDLTRQALEEGHVDVALLFATDPSIVTDARVELVDDKGLQPAENVTPLVHDEVIRRFGPALVDVVDGVSAELTTQGLRGMNAQLESGVPAPEVARRWLAKEGLS